MTTSLVVVEHPPAVLQTLLDRLALEDDLRITGVASDAASAVDLVLRQQPDVVLLDAEMPDLDVSTAVHALTTSAPRSAILILTLEPTGADGQLPTVTAVGKHEGIRALLTAIRHVGLRKQPQ